MDYKHILWTIGLLGVASSVQAKEETVQSAQAWAAEHKLDVYGVSCDTEDFDQDQYVDCLLLVRKAEKLVRIECTKPELAWVDCHEKDETVDITKFVAPQDGVGIRRSATIRPKTQLVAGSQGEQLICLPASEAR